MQNFCGNSIRTMEFAATKVRNYIWNFNRVGWWNKKSFMKYVFKIILKWFKRKSNWRLDIFRYITKVIIKCISYAFRVRCKSTIRVYWLRNKEVSCRIWDYWFYSLPYITNIFVIALKEMILLIFFNFLY